MSLVACGPLPTKLYSVDMPRDIDDLLARIKELSERLALSDAPDQDRRSMLAEREALRSDARQLTNAARHPRSVETEVEALTARLDEIESSFVRKGYAEKYLTKGFSDPGAYSATINRRLSEHHADEIERIRARIATLREFTPRDVSE